MRRILSYHGPYKRPRRGKSKLNFYLNAGARLSFLLSGKFEATGSSTHMGQYPDYANVTLFDIEEYGFSTEDISESADWEVNSMNMAGYASAGISYSFGKAAIRIGPSVVMGLSDLKYETAKHRDDFVSLMGVPDKTNTQMFPDS